ncbi:MAG: hypothetical protein M1828_001199 [Chrysothrix sp. TS-e1954]|nr:MAG: hypothetical protein M1828_001199 [Chrysothrix sp. TS-e1954]
MALSIPPSDFWSGIDGQWSTFTLQIGTPQVTVDVLISTSQPVEYVIEPNGCPTGNATCAAARGTLWDPKKSTSWNDTGILGTNLEINLGYSQLGQYGYDTVALGYQGSGLPTLGNQIVIGISETDFYLGYFGLLAKPFNLTSYDDPYPSFLQTLKNHQDVPSLSWAYTAGAKYRENGWFASLTLGGYDASRMDPGSISVAMNSDVTQYLSVGVQEINVAGSPSGGGNALSSGITMMLDSTLPYIWLPRDACDSIANAFNLDYDSDTELYTISDTVRESLLSQTPPPSVAFILGTSPSGGETVQISLPYQAFDLNAQPPLVDNSTNYFPIKRAANESQYVLGRTFFQEAYVIADFEHSNFSVSQTNFVRGQRAAITAIQPSSAPTVVPHSKDSSNHAGAIAGAVVGVVVVLAIIALAAFFLLRRRRRRRQAHEAAILGSMKPKGVAPSEDRVPPYSPPAEDMVELPNNYFNRHELEATESHPGTPKHGYYASSPERAKATDGHDRPRSPLSELDARPVHELPGSVGDNPSEQAQTAKPLHLRTISRDEIRSPSVVSATAGDASPSDRARRPERPISPDALPGAFVQSPLRGFGSRERVSTSRDVSPPTSATLNRRLSGEVSPTGSRTMSPTLESKRSVSSRDSLPIFLDKNDE